MLLVVATAALVVALRGDGGPTDQPPCPQCGGGV